MAQGDFELDPTLGKTLPEDRPAPFFRQPAFEDRVLEWTIPVLWLVVAAVIAAVFLSL